MDADRQLSPVADHAAVVHRRFSETASTYDRARRQLIPGFDEFYGTAVDLVVARNASPRRILDLGAGTGLLSELVATAAPNAELVLLDDSAEMLDRARERLGVRLGVSFIVGRFDHGLPPGPWDAIVSALAIHHLDDPGKQALFNAIAGALEPGGVFVNAEQILGSTPRVEEWIDDRWETAVRAAGVSDDDLAASRHRMATDRCSPVEDQLSWMRDAGLVDVDCYFRHLRFAVLAGWR